VSQGGKQPDAQHLHSQGEKKQYGGKGTPVVPGTNAVLPGGNNATATEQKIKSSFRNGDRKLLKVNLGKPNGSSTDNKTLVPVLVIPNKPASPSPPRRTREKSEMKQPVVGARDIPKPSESVSNRSRLNTIFL